MELELSEDLMQMLIVDFESFPSTGSHMMTGTLLKKILLITQLQGVISNKR